MAKRFTDTEKFKDKWYRRLTPVLKCLWEYLISECNHAGVLEIDLEAMSFHIGAEISLKDLKKFDDRIFFISDDLIFIPKFISFQYGELNPENKVHRSVLEILNKYNLDPSKPLASTLLGTKDKDKESVKESDKESGGILRGEFLQTDPMKIPVDKIHSSWNEIIKPKEPVRLTFSRRQKIVDRWDDSEETRDIEFWRKVFKLAKEAQVKDWKPRFDWIFENDRNYNKLIEGNYEQSEEENNDRSKMSGWTLNPDV